MSGPWRVEWRVWHPSHLPGWASVGWVMLPPGHPPTQPDKVPWYTQRELVWYSLTRPVRLSPLVLLLTLVRLQRCLDRTLVKRWAA